MPNTPVQNEISATVPEVDNSEKKSGQALSVDHETTQEHPIKSEDKPDIEENEGDEPPPKRKRKCCSCCRKDESCKACLGRVCPYFPRCCQFPLQNCLQILAMVDLVVAIFNIGVWLYFNQYDPFARNMKGVLNKTDLQATTTPPPSATFHSNMIDPSDFSETTTIVYGQEHIDDTIDGQDTTKTSKIGYVFRRFQQEVENMCGRHYYSKYLMGHDLDLTRGLFDDMLILTYLSESMYLFIDTSILTTTCCFFDYTSGRMYLIIIWNMELVPVLSKLYLIVESRSHRLCIMQYGLGKSFRGLDALLWMHFIPMILFRAYKLLVFTYFVASILELGNLEHQTRIQGVNLHDYVEKHNEFLRMDKNRDKSSSEDVDVDNV